MYNTILHLRWSCSRVACICLASASLLISLYSLAYYFYRVLLICWLPFPSPPCSGCSIDLNAWFVSPLKSVANNLTSISQLVDKRQRGWPAVGHANSFGAHANACACPLPPPKELNACIKRRAQLVEHQSENVQRVCGINKLWHLCTQ